MTKLRRAGGLSPLATLALLAATVAVLYFAQDVLQPTVLAVLLSFLLARPVSWLERRRYFGRVTSVLTVVGVAFLVLGGLGYVVGRQVYSLAEELPNYRANVETKIERVKAFVHTDGDQDKTIVGFFSALSRTIRNSQQTPATQSTTAPAAGSDGVVSGAAEQLSKPIKGGVREISGGPPATAPGPAGSTPENPIYTVAQGTPSTPLQQLQSYLAYVVGPLGTAGLIVVFVVFMLLEREALRDRFIAVISRGNYTVTTRAINDAAERISRYLTAQSIVNGSYGLIIGMSLFLIGVLFGRDAEGHYLPFPSYVLWGLLCAVLRFIPYVGPGLAMLFPIALSLAVYPGFTVAFATIGMFLLVELLSNNVMEPWLYGASTGLGQVAIIVSAVFWTWLWGSVGLLVATPLTVCMAVIGKYVGPLAFMHTLLSDEDALPPAVQFYQRLLAGDVPDAERIVAKVAEREGAARVPDVVYLPAVRLARRDRAEGELTAETENRIYDDTLAIAHPPSTPPATSDPSRPLVLCYPAHHRADEVTLRVLADALAPLDVRTAMLTTRQLPVDVENAVARDKPQFLVLGVVPPGGLPQTRYLCRRLRRKFPDLTILVGYWGRPRHFDKLLVKLRTSGASYVLTNAEQTREQIRAMLPKAPAAEPPAEAPAS